YDEQREPVSDLITWQDRRALRMIPGSNENVLERLQKSVPTDFRQRSGCDLRAGYGLVTLIALKLLDQLPESFAHAADITGHFAHQLTGSEFRIDPTFAASWGMYELSSGKLDFGWSDPFEIPSSCFPSLVQTGQMLGQVSARAGSGWSLPEGIPVYAGIGDHQAAVHASLVNPETDVMLNLGTGGQVSWISSELTPADEIEVRPYLDGQFLRVGAGIVGGATWAWFVDQIHSWIGSLGLTLSREELLARLNDQLLQFDDSVSLKCEPLFLGTRANPQRLGSFTQIDRSSFSLGAMGQAVLAGIIEQLCLAYEQDLHRLPQLDRVITTGNLFSYYPWLEQIIEQRWQVPVSSPEFAEQAAVGAARLALRSEQKTDSSSQ
ncbi:MAG: hypothetical protein KDA78_05990, partial [Planctomycetaceae bacterium]|nr:hypothetical protein [Planctomycetaceae bacterium]